MTWSFIFPFDFGSFKHLKLLQCFENGYLFCNKSAIAINSWESLHFTPDIKSLVQIILGEFQKKTIANSAMKINK